MFHDHLMIVCLKNHKQNEMKNREAEFSKNYRHIFIPPANIDVGAKHVIDLVQSL